ncbi:MAG TPA: hypothetical protein VK204_17705 [Nocardioidaceae bacterium]|nr:hypothetical protein [Nocardioidaceae bacterium]
MKAVFVVTWRDVRAGREATAVEYAREVDAYWAGPASRRLCSEPSWRPVENGTSHWFVEGELTDLLLLTSTTRARWLTLKGAFVAEGFEEHIYATGRRRLRAMESLLREEHLI